ncbi:LytR/AlgR family response regulator transcription factor [Chitinophaga qingshengii]|uniref:Response regulator transcription factor n=1 Tax=Chitinophaga qingshengii TaxID=1569794 RepID=A0ABR7TL61_9BACT|nr:LytTR family DNA-binding domain-containing protein [Chitinophaga qingshengii]MBC9931231.1 response regulator transcription factor [Chitinophaga qingshengii]
MKISCIITDDEPIARKGLAGYVEKIDFLTLAGVCEDALSLNNLLRQQPVDLLFLDIEMPYINGVELLESLTHPPKVIFTTAYEQYALKGFELDAIDYLMKPISFERFLKAANRALEVFSPATATPVAERDIYIKTGEKLVRVLLEDIIFIEAMENYVNIHTTHGRYLTHATLKAVAENVTGPEFVQTHKSYIINTRKITSIEGNRISMGQAFVPVSRGLKDSVMNIILKDKLLKK